jgi:hypothetical protein
MAVVAIAGSRSLPSAFAPLVFRVAVALRRSSRSVAVGCASGADAVVLASCLSLRIPVSVFAVGSPSGAGFWRGSAPFGLLHAAGSDVHWFAGGPLSVELVKRLAARSRVCVAAAAAGGEGSGLVVFLSSPSSRGSLLACRFAASAGLPVVIFCCGFSPSALPALGLGRWVSAGSGVWSSAVRWQPSSLFSG